MGDFASIKDISVQIEATRRVRPLFENFKVHQKPITDAVMSEEERKGELPCHDVLKARIKSVLFNLYNTGAFKANDAFEPFMDCMHNKDDMRRFKRALKEVAQVD